MLTALILIDFLIYYRYKPKYGASFLDWLYLDPVLSEPLLGDLLSQSHADASAWLRYGKNTSATL